MGLPYYSSLPSSIKNRNPTRDHSYPPSPVHLTPQYPLPHPLPRTPTTLTYEKKFSNNQDQLHGNKHTPSSNVSQDENSKLIAYWIKRLQREREEYLRTYKLSPYDLLSYNEKLRRALDRIKARKEAKLDYQIAFNALLRDHRKTRRLRQTEKSKPNYPLPQTTSYQET
ncbi:hypothetical protein PCASD_21076 [Puccinia coronata f. sp. avenae]|uniref:Uncharacterized protein n=1 Tax=Puccinia coronata f. sp. avenae TaxID=200324 RepID=A0A2N5TSC3_9BASI|nr:hypothetical protein PCASD_21076 [Puccinia coronata f. sp. avenae]